MGVPLIILPPMTTAAVGPVVPSHDTFGEDVRRAFPPALIEALDSVGAQIRVELLDPMLATPTPEALAVIFTNSLGRFKSYYYSMLLILMGYLSENPQQLAALTLRTFDDSTQFLRIEGTRWLGQDTCLRALRGISTMARIARACTARLEQPMATGAVDPEVWVNSAVAHTFALSSALHALKEIRRHGAETYRLSNVVLLAQWSDVFAQRVFHASKQLGILVPPSLVRQPEGSAAEDAELAEVGLAEYAAHLASDEQ